MAPAVAQHLPIRAEQGGLSLAPAAARPLLHLLADADMWHTQSANEALSQVYAPTLFAMVARLRADPLAARHLPPEVDAAAALFMGTAAGSASTTHHPDPAELHRMRHVVDTQVGILSPTRKPAPVHSLAAPPPPLSGKGHDKNRDRYLADRAQHSVYFYGTDPTPDLGIPFGLDPSAYPMFQHFLDQHGDAFRARHALMRDAAGTMPHPEQEVVTRAYLQPFRLPPDPGSERRPCCLGGLCRFMWLAETEARPDWGYVAREFKLPSQEAEWVKRRARGVPVSDEADGPPGPCIDCILYAMTAKYYFELRERRPHILPVNTFTVLVGEGEYARDVMLLLEVDGYPTGIVGNVPAYKTSWRQYDTLPGSERSVLREVHMDFQSSLSQANACLGSRKLRPLAGPWAMLPLPRAALLAPLRTRVAVSREEQHAGWAQFARSAHAGILADRALFSAVAAEPADQSHLPTLCRVPAAWLRRHLLWTDSESTLWPSRMLTLGVAQRLGRDTLHKLAALLIPEQDEEALFQVGDLLGTD
jgi:hypothetical protein